MNRLIIIGAGGHGKVIADNALKNGYTDISFVDDNATGKCLEFPIIGNSADIEHLNDGNTDFVIGVGNNATRKNISEKYSVNWVTLIHPSAIIATHVSIGVGTVVMAGAIVNSATSIGSHCIINTGAIIEHDNAIGDYVHISPGAKLSGTVSVGESTWIGTGANVINGISVCANVIIGTGAVITKVIDSEGTYVGVPARKIR